MNNEIKFIDSLLSADENLSEGWIALQCGCEHRTYKHLNIFMVTKSRPTTLQVMKHVKESDMSNLDKFYALEGVACDLGHVAIRMGFIEKLRVKT